jgi:hypothetical protein
MMARIRFLFMSGLLNRLERLILYDRNTMSWKPHFTCHRRNKPQIQQPGRAARDLG